MSFPAKVYAAPLSVAAAFGATLALLSIPAGEAAQAQAIETVETQTVTVQQQAQAAQDAAPDTARPVPSQLLVANAAIDGELVCLAKVVVHEAGNQSREGQLAVAQVVMNRLRSPRFPKSICGVVMQPGQFFNVHGYSPPKDGRWKLALEIARDARLGISEPVVGEALFFRAAQVNPAFFRSRPIVGRIGNHYFHQ